MRRLALVTARGGSKGLPGKNVRPFGGKPLVAWSIAAALESGTVDRVVLSTDSEEIAEAGRAAGADVPFLRPAELATDGSSSLDAALHALDQEPQPIDLLLLLQPTSPLRTADDLRASLVLLNQDTDAVVGVTEASHHPWITYRRNASGYLEALAPAPPGYQRRQDMPTAYALNGAVYWIRTEALRRERTFFPPRTAPYPMPWERSIDIDDLQDFELAEWLLERRQRIAHAL